MKIGNRNEALVIVALVAGLGMMAACDNGETATSGPCPDGICANGTGSASGGGNATSSGTAGAGGGVGCETWVCSPWDTQGNGDQATRSCIDTSACGSETYKPSEAATLPALDENYYRCNVEPILDAGCAQLGCHGVEPDLAMGDPGRGLRVYHRGRLRVSGEIIEGEAGCLDQPDKNSEDCIGSTECACWTKPHLPIEWQRNFDAARGFGLDANGQPLADAASSELLTQPLKGGGLPHAGIKAWQASDADYQTIKNWLEGATLASCTTSN